MQANDERAYEIQYEETTPGVWEGVLTDHQTGQQYGSGSLRELVAILGRLLDRAAGDGDGPEPVGKAA